MTEHVSTEDEKILICGLTLRQIGPLVTWLGALLHAVAEKDWERLKDYKFSEIKQYIDIMQKAECEFGPLDATEMFGTLEIHFRDRKAERIFEDLATIFLAFLRECFSCFIGFS